MDDATIVAIVFGCFGSIAAMALIFNNLKRVYQYVTKEMKYHWAYENKRFSYLRKDVINAKKERFSYVPWLIDQLHFILATTNISSLNDAEATDLMYLLNEFRSSTENNSAFFLGFICTGLLGTNRVHCHRWWQSKEPNDAQPIHCNISDNIWHIIHELHRRKCPQNDICTLDIGQQTIELLLQICNNDNVTNYALQTCGLIIQDIINVRYEITGGVIDIRLAAGFNERARMALDGLNNNELRGADVVEKLQLCCKQ